MTTAHSDVSCTNGNGHPSSTSPPNHSNERLHAILNGPPRPLSDWKFERATNFKQLENYKDHDSHDVSLRSHLSAELSCSTTADNNDAMLFKTNNGIDENKHEHEKTICESKEIISNEGFSPTSCSPRVESSTIYTIPTSRQGPEYFAGAPQDGLKTLCIIMVGLPARGKTFLAQKICRLLGWHGCRAKVLNVQVAWRKFVMDHCRRHSRNRQNAEVPSDEAKDVFDERKMASCPIETGFISAENFHSLVSNPNSVEREYYRKVLKCYANEAKDFFRNGCEVLVLNDNFPTEEMRGEVEDLFAPLCSQLFFMEVVSDNEKNKQFDFRCAPDVLEYSRSVDPAVAAEDFARRVECLKSVYTTLTPENSLQENANLHCVGEVHLSSATNKTKNPQSKAKRFVKVFDGAKIEVHGITGYTASRIVSYVMNLSQLKIQHPIYFTRHGESEYNIEDRIGGDPPLTARGEAGARELLEFLASLKQSVSAEGQSQSQSQSQSQAPSEAGAEGQSQSQSQSQAGAGAGAGAERAGRRGDVEVWTSQLRRALQTVGDCEKLLDVKVLQWSSLNEIHAGICEDYTYAEVREKYPLIDQFRQLNKYSFRYPEGESYQDLVMRLEPVIMELENADHVVVVVAHQAILRALLAYFGSTSAESCVRLEVPHRTVWRCTYDSKGIAWLNEMNFARQ